MDFRLCYRGQLPVANDTRNFVKTKHEIRSAFNQQLRNLLKLEPRLYNETMDAQLADTIRGKVLRPRDSSHTGPYWVQVEGIAFFPIIDRPRGLTCHLEIVLLRRTDELARILREDGDIDNNLKIVLDALRIPHQKSELPASPKPQELWPMPWMLCVMEDDGQITKLSVQTGRLLEPYESEHDSDVRVDVHVTIKSNSQHWLSQG